MEHEIINHRHLRNYTVIPNEILQTTDLSFFAKGLLCYLLSLPEDWKVQAGTIAQRFKETEAKVLRGLKELIEVGYCKRTPLRKDGRLRGQRYQITDIRGDFSDPLIFGGSAQNSAPSIFQTSENTDPQKNGGSVQNIIDENKVNISIIQSKEGETRDARPKKNTRYKFFENSEIAKWEDFEKTFGTDEYAGADIRHYYDTIKDWATAKGAKYIDWIAFVRNWMRRDYKEGRLVRTQQNNPGGMQDWQYEAIMRDRAMDDDSLWRQD